MSEETKTEEAKTEETTVKPVETEVTITNKEMDTINNEINKTENEKVEEIKKEVKQELSQEQRIRELEKTITDQETKYNTALQELRTEYNKTDEEKKVLETEKAKVEEEAKLKLEKEKEEEVEKKGIAKTAESPFQETDNTQTQPKSPDEVLASLDPKKLEDDFFNYSEKRGR